MKLAIISDAHLGFGQGTEREEDSFKAFGEALQKSQDCDLLLLAGDLFESRTPNIEIITKAVELLRKFQRGKGRPTPIVAIHGTHERRVKGLLNPVEALGRMGLLGYLHCDKIELDISGEKVAVFGMSGVPDQFSEAVLKEWNPKPIKGIFNILMTHQSISPFLYAKHLLPLEKIPEGFDLYVNGHVHDHKKAEYCGSPFLIPGSLIPTEISGKPKPCGFFKLEAKEGKVGELEFVELENQRRVYLLELEKPDFKTVCTRLEEVLDRGHKLKPLVKIRTTGKEGIPINEIKTKYEDRAILSFSRHGEEEIEAKGLSERIESVQEMGRKLLNKNLEALKLDPEKFERVFELLAEKRVEEARKVLESDKND